MSSNISFDTLDSRKTAFMRYYDQGNDITEIANALNINVHHSNKLPDNTLGAIQYNDEKKVFEMIINVKNKIDTVTSKSRILLTVAHEVAHWIYDYKEMKEGTVFCETETLDTNDRRELIASIVASNIMLGLNKPLVDQEKFHKIYNVCNTKMKEFEPIYIHTQESVEKLLDKQSL